MDLLYSHPMRWLQTSPPPRPASPPQTNGQAWLKVLLFSTAAIIASLNMLFAYYDSSRSKALLEESHHAIVITVNLVLFVGAVFRRQLLVAIWICAYSVFLVMSIIKVLQTRVFSWTPGVSFSSTVPIMNNLRLDENFRPAIAVTITMTSYVTIIAVFLLGLQLEWNEDSLICTSRDASCGATALPSLSSSTSIGDETLSTSLPAYSDVEDVDSGLPPYEEAMKRLKEAEEDAAVSRILLACSLLKKKKGKTGRKAKRPAVHKINIA